jgi:hypothetical protein
MSERCSLQCNEKGLKARNEDHAFYFFALSNPGLFIFLFLQLRLHFILIDLGTGRKEGEKVGVDGRIVLLLFNTAIRPEYGPLLLHLSSFSSFVSSRVNRFYIALFNHSCASLFSLTHAAVLRKIHLFRLRFVALSSGNLRVPHFLPSFLPSGGLVAAAEREEGEKEAFNCFLLKKVRGKRAEGGEGKKKELLFSPQKAPRR